MKKTGTLRSQAGFSLVELMVVVAIIGVLAAMSAGQVQKQIAKARQSEAKTNLSTLWSSMEAFKAEYNQYTTDFLANKLSFTGKIYYHVGFGAAFAAPTPAQGYSGATNNAAINTSVQTAVTCNGCVPVPGATAPPGTATATNTTFNAIASGEPIRGTNDQWRIDNLKALTNPVDGIQ